MAFPVLPLVIVGSIMLFAASKFSFGKRKARLPKLLSDDCSRALVTAREVDESVAVLKWGLAWVGRNPLPPKPSDPETLRGYIARYTMAIFEEGAPQCTHLFDKDLELWPHAARVLFEQVVYSTSIALESQGYDVAVPSRPPTF
jgi:hypothetical protein